MSNARPACCLASQYSRKNTLSPAPAWLERSLSASLAKTPCLHGNPRRPKRLVSEGLLGRERRRTSAAGVDGPPVPNETRCLGTMPARPARRFSWRVLTCRISPKVFSSACQILRSPPCSHVLHILFTRKNNSLLFCPFPRFSIYFTHDT